MKRLLLSLAVIAVAATSCQKDFVENSNDTEIKGIEEQTSPYAVSEEEALARLEDELALLYGEDTRASQRQVRSMRPVKFNDIAPATRSNGNNVDNLLYIVEFEDNQGSAILGADKRLESVFAVLEEGTITAEDFDNAVNGVNTEDINTFLAGAIADEAIEQMAIIDTVITPPYYEHRYSIVTKDTVVNVNQAPLLDTHWNDNGFYRDSTVDSFGDPVEPGSLTIAMAQFLVEVEFPEEETITIGNDTYSRDILKQCRYNGNITNTVKEHVADYIRSVGVALGNDYEHDQNNESLDSAEELLEDYGFYSADTVSCVFDTVNNYVNTKQQPIIIRGANDNDNEEKHFWVLDGIRHLVYSTIIRTYEGTRLIRTEHYGPFGYCKVHCNFGKGGRSNGYYTWSIFDVSEELDEEDIVADKGDLTMPIGGNRVYSTELKLLVYELTETVQ